MGLTNWHGTTVRKGDVTIKEWREKIGVFLTFNERDILTNAGKVSNAIAEQLALEQYEIFHRNRLAQAAQQEAVADDAMFKRVEATVSRKLKKINLKIPTPRSHRGCGWCGRSVV